MREQHNNETGENTFNVSLIPVFIFCSFPKLILTKKVPDEIHTPLPISKILRTKTVFKTMRTVSKLFNWNRNCF